jgi:hypothetical protein
VFEEQALWRVEDIGQGELGLQDRSTVAVFGLAMMGEDIGDTLWYHRSGSGRAVFASCRSLGRLSVPLSLVLPELVINRRSGPQDARRSPQASPPMHSLSNKAPPQTDEARDGPIHTDTCVVGLKRSLVIIIFDDD